MQITRRTLAAEVRVIDKRQGCVEYIASDETIDSYREVIRAAGWRFTNFSKNAPFVDSHKYESVDCLLGRVIDFRIEGNRLIETVQWAIDAALPETHLANIGWKLTLAGYLKAVSVGFRPVRMVSKWDNDPTGYIKELRNLGLDKSADTQKPHVIYQEQEQVELSAVIIGANPNALAKALRNGDISRAQFSTLSPVSTKSESRRRIAAIFDDRNTSRAQFSTLSPATGKSETQKRIAAICDRIIRDNCPLL